MPRRLILALTLAIAAQAALAGGSFAATLVGGGSDAGPAGISLARPGPEAEAKPGKPVRSYGYDISYPQCGGAYPSDPAFAIVGVNGGRVYSANPCLASEIVWGGGTAAELYINTANPGPAISSYWPLGQEFPRFCDPANPDTADCAFDYGWNAAKHSFETAQAAYAELGIEASPALTTWWLDVETSNSWRDDDLTLNVAALQGEVAFLRDVAGVTRLGFYSTTYQWGLITGGTKVFAEYPSWGAGARNERIARSVCDSTTTSFTGGPLVLMQFPYSGFDANIRC